MKKMRTSSLFTILLLLSSVNIFAQTNNPTVNSANTAAQITSTPKHMWEVGLNGGFNFVSGDVDFAPGFGFGLHVRKAIDNIFSVRVDGQYRILKGLEKEDSRNPDATHSAALNSLGYGEGMTNWFPNYKTNMITASAQLIMSLNQFRFIKPTRTINPYAFIGVGFTTFEVKVNALDENNNPYNFTAPPSSGDLDGTYETKLEINSDDIGKSNFSPIADFGLGVAFKLSPRVNIGLEQKLTVLFGRGSDFVDGAYYRSLVDQTNKSDLILSTFVRLNFNIGNKEKMSEPLWWINPLDFILNDIAELKARPKLDLTDTDNDGIIDMLDQEKDSPAGAPVDTKGKTLDSDNDGIPNYVDKEPFSPPNYKVNSEGVAQTPKYISTDEANKVIEDKIKDFRITRGGGLTDWFLPMIHFDLDKYTIKNSEVEKIHQVATVLQSNPSLKVLVEGHTDGTAGPDYNRMLSYNRAKSAIEYMVNRFGIPRERLVLVYEGEDVSLIETKKANYVNRRVEFRVAKPTDTEMQKPSGPNAGSGKIEGSRDAGY